MRISRENVIAAEDSIVDFGIDRAIAQKMLQNVGYKLLGAELYNKDGAGSSDIQVNPVSKEESEREYPEDMPENKNKMFSAKVSMAYNCCRYIACMDEEFYDQYTDLVEEAANMVNAVENYADPDALADAAFGMH